MGIAAQILQLLWHVYPFTSIYFFLSNFREIMGDIILNVAMLSRWLIWLRLQIIARKYVIYFLSYLYSKERWMCIDYKDGEDELAGAQRAMIIDVGIYNNQPSRE